jgi:cysteine-rich repeat protein
MSSATQRSIAAITLASQTLPTRLLAPWLSLLVVGGCALGSGDRVCPDDVIELGEECDDGNGADGDGCSSECLLEFCGDGAVQAALGEDCDDGNMADGDGCDHDCRAEPSEECGNGAPEGSEECDDGNTRGDDGCSAACRVERCGDGVMQASEACDDGNTADEDGCSAGCAVEVCGDAVVQAGLDEACDDGNTADGDGCSGECLSELCGDGTTQAGLGEECDDGNMADGDGCSATCSTERCGDGVLQTGLGETCDDRNTTPGDGCGATCRLDTLVLKPDAASGRDAAIFNRNATDMATNYGNREFLYALAWTWSGAPGTYRSLLEFPLPAAMQGCTVGTAVLTLSHYAGQDNSDLSGPNDYQLQRITAAWDEATVTWNNQPAADAASTITAPAPGTSSAEVDIDVTPIVNYWFSHTDSNHGFLIRLANEAHYRALSFASSDHTDLTLRPELSVTFTACP